MADRYNQGLRPGPTEFIRGVSDSLPDAKDSALALGAIAAGWYLGSRKPKKKKKKK